MFLKRIFELTHGLSPPRLGVSAVRTLDTRPKGPRFNS